MMAPCIRDSFHSGLPTGQIKLLHMFFDICFRTVQKFYSLHIVTNQVESVLADQPNRLDTDFCGCQSLDSSTNAITRAFAMAGGKEMPFCFNAKIRLVMANID